MNIFETIYYKSKQAIKIGREHLNELKRGEYCEFAEHLKLPPKEENLIIEMLPEDIFLYIFKYLSPGDLIRVASACKALNELSQDINTWRNITYNYNQFLILKEIEFEKRDGVYQENEIPLYGIIEKLESLSNNNIDNEFINDSELITEFITDSEFDKKSNLINLNPKQKLIEKKPNLSSFFRRRKNEDPFIILLEENEIKRNLIEYIEKIPNPQKEIISKAKLIYNSILERKQQIDKNIKIRRKQERRRKQKEARRQFLKQYKHQLLSLLFFLLITIFVSIILINVYIDNSISSNILYFFIPIFLIICITASFFFYLYKVLQDSEILIYETGMIILFIELLLIGLRIETTIKGSWLLIFIPFFIFIGFIIVYYINFILENNDLIYKLLVLVLSIFVFFFIFLILLGLRLDQTIKSNYGTIFIPFFLINLVTFIILFYVIYGKYKHNNSDIPNYVLCIVFIILAVILLFEIFLVLFLEGNSNFTHITLAFFPLYFLLIFLMCFPLCFQAFKAWMKANFY